MYFACFLLLCSFLLLSRTPAPVCEETETLYENVFLLFFLLLLNFVLVVSSHFSPTPLFSSPLLPFPLSSPPLLVCCCFLHTRHDPHTELRTWRRLVVLLPLPFCTHRKASLMISIPGASLLTGGVSEA